MQYERWGINSSVAGLIPAVALDSSMARIPLPLEAILFCKPHMFSQHLFSFVTG